MFILLTTLVSLDKVFNMYFYIVEIVVSLYNLHRIYYTGVSEFLKVVIFSDTVLYLFSKHIEFFLKYYKIFSVSFKTFAIISNFRVFADSDPFLFNFSTVCYILF